MKVILMEDVKSLGKKGDMVEINEGYARNFILKKKLGVEATAKNINDLKLKKANSWKRPGHLLQRSKKNRSSFISRPVKAGKLSVLCPPRRSRRRQRLS